VAILVKLKSPHSHLTSLYKHL